VLDAGAGASLKQFDWPSAVVAADISAAIDKCRGHFANRPHVSYVQADLNRLPFADDVFDVIWSNGVLHHAERLRVAAGAGSPSENGRPGDLLHLREEGADS
jgi:ubiquinone/menaquinone biosynthesis C-methylase UbiE